MSTRRSASRAQSSADCVRARYGGTYLMNNDMTLDARALAELMPLRAPDVFAAASQIFQQDASGRREETGFTDWYANRSGVHLYHAPVRRRTGASAASLRKRRRGAVPYGAAYPLRARARCYDPFLLGGRGVGRACLARRTARALLSAVARRTQHRMTTARFYSSAEIDRIVERNPLALRRAARPGGFGASHG
jgi:hypothetical protein